jgi:hypothetical protein
VVLCPLQMAGDTADAVTVPEPAKVTGSERL